MQVTRRRTAMHAAVLAGLAAMLLAGAAQAEHRRSPPRGRDSSAALKRGRALARELQYVQAVEELEVVAGNKTLPAGERAEAFEILGVLHVTRERLGSAQRAFKQLLTLDPGHELLDSEVSTRVHEVFTDVRESFEPQVTTTISVEAPESIPDQGPMRLNATVHGNRAGVDSVVLFFRRQGEMAFSRLDMDCEGPECAAEVPNPGRDAALGYYVEVQAPSGYVLARTGSIGEPWIVAASVLPEPVEALEPDAPTDDEDEPDEPQPTAGEGRWYTSWWFWTIVGAVVAGGTTAAVVLSLPPDLPGDGNLGAMRLP